MRLGEGRVDSVNDSEGLKLSFPARTPETRPRVTDDDLAGSGNFNRTEFTLSPPVTSKQRLFYLHSGHLPGWGFAAQSFVVAENPYPSLHWTG
ncbi:hypothetical protein [Thermincola potens]|uniref:hypothetical protein n=1 Tax=Thermincola potens TaxID=863643 RepID=UPI0012FD06F6|nr:hypothetical protein [Thermincola potens]